MRYLIGVSSLLCCAALAVPAAADARVIELGKPLLEGIAPSCPNSHCYAVSRTTAVQTKEVKGRSEINSLVKAPEDGRIVAWTIRLATPLAVDEKFFERSFGGAASAGISVIRPTMVRARDRKGKYIRDRRGRYRMEQELRAVAHSPISALKHFYGQTVQFPLMNSIAVKKNDVIALAVPTWAPALAIGLQNESSWRATRSTANCQKMETQSAVTKINTAVKFSCVYRTAQVKYSVTMVTLPKPNVVKPAKPAAKKPAATSTKGKTTGSNHRNLGKPVRR